MHVLIPPEVWVIGADDLAKYQLIFDHHNNEGYVSGPNAAALFNKSGLAKEVWVWLVDWPASTLQCLDRSCERCLC